MIPRLAARRDPVPRAGFFDRLTEAGFRGDLEAGEATRTVFSTDNSIYQVKPQAVIFPVLGVTLVGIDPSMTLTYRSEYVHVPGLRLKAKVLLAQEWLAQALHRLKPVEHNDGSYRLFVHCTERSNAAPRLRTGCRCSHILAHA